MLETKFNRPEEALRIHDGSKVAGYASIFGARDQGGDTVVPGAYAASLARLAAAGGRVRMLWQHDASQPIGVWDTVREDERGLWVEGRLLTEVTRAREAAALMEAGAVDGLSIGYRTVRSEKSPGGGRRLLELELWEVSLVTFPMLSVARVAAKGASVTDDIAAAMAVLAQGIDSARAAMRE
ncbi:HK97 family phage prohead protease [Pararhodobacter sp. SW119]|uniref:HK97 family phage prohead protease n=1 Tax=Pararhodobacter sp. SW119 TaxID=2780075 RepID=UPI001ADFD461|nr:HK97 family phage prohead protease [Pararhodobacter sp. SW119]